MHVPETTWATRVAEVAGILRTSMVGGEIGAGDSTDGGKYRSAPHQLIVGYKRFSPARMASGSVCYARHNHGREGENLILYRAFSAVLGLVLALAGTGAAGYLPTDFKGETLVS